MWVCVVYLCLPEYAGNTSNGEEKPVNSLNCVKRLMYYLV